MKGEVDIAGRALLRMNVSRASESEAAEIVVWIDTAFDGELVFSNETIRGLQLKQASAVDATLADGTRVILETFECWIDWFGERQAVEVIANEGRFPLLGIGLLKGRKLTIDYESGELSLE